MEPSQNQVPARNAPSTTGISEKTASTQDTLNRMIEPGVPNSSKRPSHSHHHDPHSNIKNQGVDTKNKLRQKSHTPLVEREKKFINTAPQNQTLACAAVATDVVKERTVVAPVVKILKTEKAAVLLAVPVVFQNTKPKGREDKKKFVANAVVFSVRLDFEVNSMVLTVNNKLFNSFLRRFSQFAK